MKTTGRSSARDLCQQVVARVEVGREAQVQHVDELLMAAVAPEPQKIRTCSSVAAHGRRG